MTQPGFWDNQELAQGLVQEKKKFGAVVSPKKTRTGWRPTSAP
jgi:hypothetical protein